VAELPISEVQPPVLPFEPQKTHKYEKAPRYSGPKVGIDGKGNLWVTCRQNFGSRYTTHPGGYWLTFARRLEGDRWSEPIEIHHSDGLPTNRPPLLPPPQGGLLIIHNGDDRYTVPNKLQNRIWVSHVDLP